MVAQQQHHRDGSGLVEQEEGAILIAGMFVTAFLVGVLYMLIGASTAMQHGELMHDGADSAAFSAAQTHAKGMNLIALSNMVKVGATATIVAPASIILGATATIAWITDGTFRTIRYGYTIPFLGIVIAQATIEYVKAQGKIPKLISSADKVQDAIVNDLPGVAEHVINRDFLETFSPPVTGFFLSPLQKLPVKNESKAKMCLRMAPYATMITKRAFKRVPSRKIRRLGLGFSIPNFAVFCAAYAKPARMPTGVPGDDGFQVRAYAGGEELSTTGERGVRVATWGADPGPDAITEMRDQLSGIAFAQGEYYHSGRTSVNNALFHITWKARLRRFRGGGPTAGDCARRNAPAEACAALPEFLRQMQWATVH